MFSKDSTRIAPRVVITMTTPRHLVTVYRVENADGTGPFENHLMMQAMHEAMGDRDRDWHSELPASRDFFRRIAGKPRCGIDNARDIVRWFPGPMREALAEHGYALSVYRIDASQVHRAVGAMQVMFETSGLEPERRPFAIHPERRIRREAARAEAQRYRAPCPAPSRILLAA